MNNTKKTIGWCDKSWNPITGCKHNCWYCYANRIYIRFNRSFEPTYHLERILEPWDLKKPSKIFVCSVSDLFAPWTPEGWRGSVLRTIFDCPVKHTFQLLTKNPERIPKNYEFPENVWVGTTVTGENGDDRNIEAIKLVKGNRFVSFEPLLAKIDVSNSRLESIDWVIIGKLTGSRRVKLDLDWVAGIQHAAQMLGIPIFEKNNLGLENPIQQFPEEMAK